MLHPRSRRYRFDRRGRGRLPMRYPRTIRARNADQLPVFGEADNRPANHVSDLHNRRVETGIWNFLCAPILYRRYWPAIVSTSIRGGWFVEGGGGSLRPR